MRMIDTDLLECDTEWSDYEDGFTAYSRVQIENAPTITTKQVKYYDEEEKIWKIGEVIVDE